MPFEEYVVMEGEDIIEAGYCMSELVDMALGQRIEPASLDLTVETVNPLDVDERPLSAQSHHPCVRPSPDGSSWTNN